MKTLARANARGLLRPKRIDHQIPTVICPNPLPELPSLRVIRKHKQMAFLYPRPPQRSQPLRHQPLANPLPPMGRGHRQMVDQPAPSIVADQDGGHQLCTVQGDVARAGVACQELRY